MLKLTGILFLFFIIVSCSYVMYIEMLSLDFCCLFLLLFPIYRDGALTGVCWLLLCHVMMLSLDFCCLFINVSYFIW